METIPTMTGNSGPKAGAPRPMAPCWCCGVLSPLAGPGACRADQHAGPAKYLCVRCWQAGPRASTQAGRGASALGLALGMAALQPAGQQVLAQVADALEIKAFWDSDAAPSRSVRFGHIPAPVLHSARLAVDSKLRRPESHAGGRKRRSMTRAAATQRPKTTPRRRN